MPTKVILIRHGQTSWNLEKRYLGKTDIGLDDVGVQQAALVRDELRSEKIDRIYSSDRKRAIDFASLVFGDRRIETVPDLREIDFGSFEGLTYKELMLYYPGLYTSWINDPMSTSIPYGESGHGMKARVNAAIDKIVKENAGKVLAVVTHAGPMAVIRQTFSGARDFWQGWPEPGSVHYYEL